MDSYFQICKPFTHVGKDQENACVELRNDRRFVFLCLILFKLEVKEDPDAARWARIRTYEVTSATLT